MRDRVCRKQVAELVVNDGDRNRPDPQEANSDKRGRDTNDNYSQELSVR